MVNGPLIWYCTATARETVYVHVQLLLTMTDGQQRRRMLLQSTGDVNEGNAFRSFIGSATIQEAPTTADPVETDGGSMVSVVGAVAVMILCSCNLLLCWVSIFVKCSVCISVFALDIVIWLILCQCVCCGAIPRGVPRPIISSHDRRGYGLISNYRGGPGITSRHSEYILYFLHCFGHRIVGHSRFELLFRFLCDQCAFPALWWILHFDFPILVMNHPYPSWIETKCSVCFLSLKFFKQVRWLSEILCFVDQQNNQKFNTIDPHLKPRFIWMRNIANYPRTPWLKTVSPKCRYSESSELLKNSNSNQHGQATLLHIQLDGNLVTTYRSYLPCLSLLDIRLQVEIKDQNMYKHLLGIYHRKYKTQRNSSRTSAYSVEILC